MDWFSGENIGAIISYPSSRLKTSTALLILHLSPSAGKNASIKHKTKLLVIFGALESWWPGSLATKAQTHQVYVVY